MVIKDSNHEDKGKICNFVEVCLLSSFFCSFLFFSDWKVVIPDATQIFETCDFKYEDEDEQFYYAC